MGFDLDFSVSPVCFAGLLLSGWWVFVLGPWCDFGGVLGCVVRCQVAALWQFCPADIARHAFFRAGWRLFLYQGASFVPTPRRLTQDAFMVRDGRRLWWCPKTSLNTTRKCGSVPRRDTLRCLRGGALLSVYSYLVCVCVHVLRIKDEG